MSMTSIRVSLKSTMATNFLTNESLANNLHSYKLFYLKIVKILSLPNLVVCPCII